MQTKRKIIELFCWRFFKAFFEKRQKIYLLINIYFKLNGYYVEKHFLSDMMIKRTDKLDIFSLQS